MAPTHERRTGDDVVPRATAVDATPDSLREHSGAWKRALRVPTSKTAGG